MGCSLWKTMIPVWRYGTDNLFCTRYTPKNHPVGDGVRWVPSSAKEGILYAVFHNNIHIWSEWREIYDLRSKCFTDGRAQEVAPVIHNGIEYAAPHFKMASAWWEREMWNHAGGWVEAREPVSHKPLWTVEVYDPKYDSYVPRYLQDNFITSLKIEGGNLLVTTENGTNYSVNLRTREASKIED
jgi:hypothetical protein